MLQSRTLEPEPIEKLDLYILVVLYAIYNYYYEAAVPIPFFSGLLYHFSAVVQLCLVWIST